MLSINIIGPVPKCPKCRNHVDIRAVAIESGFNPDYQHFNCDYCEIGWYELPGSRKKRLVGSEGSARAAYDPEDRPKKLPSGRKK